MRVREMIERECCQEKDLKTYLGTEVKQVQDIHSVLRPMFCQYCGQIWIKTEKRAVLDNGYFDNVPRKVQLGESLCP